MKSSDLPASKSRLVFYSLAIIAVVALAWWFLQSKNNSNPTAASPNPVNAITQLESDTAIAEPFQQVHVAPVICTIKSNVDTVLTLAGGTSIQIPAGIFVNDHNEPVLSPVEIRFREFHSAADVITSGIPMEAVPGNGRDDCFETAGMFEIKGYADGQPIKIAEGKSLTVNLRSDATGKYDFWKYDPQTTSWINQAPANQVNIQPSESAPLPEGEASFSKLSLQVPSAPANLETDPRTPLQFKGLNMDVSKCPELRKKNSQTILLYAGKNAKVAEPKVLKQISKFRWRKGTLTPTSDANIYTLVMEGDTTLRLPVTLALSGKEFQTKQQAYEALMAEYQQGAAQREYMGKLAEQQASITRGMAIQGFGLYNHDCFYQRNDVQQVAGNFDFGGETISPKIRDKIIVYLITGNNRAIVQYPAYYWNAIRFSPTDRNSLLAVLPDGRVATFSRSDFEQSRQEMAKSNSEQPFVFKMKVQSKPVDSVDDLQQTIHRIAI